MSPQRIVTLSPFSAPDAVRIQVSEEPPGKEPVSKLGLDRFRRRALITQGTVRTNCVVGTLPALDEWGKPSPQVNPLFGREVVEGQQFFSILGQALTGLRVLRAVGLGTPGPPRLGAPH